MARNFDGAGDYLSVTDNTAIEPSTAMSIHVWLKLGASAGEQGIADKRNFSSQGGYNLRVHDAAFPLTARFLVRDGSGGEHPATIDGLATATWYSIVGTFGSSRTDVYLDGTAGTPDTTATLATNAQTLRIGAWKDADNYFLNGDLAEFAIWNRVLDTGEIAALAKGFSPLFFANGLTFYLPLVGNNSPENDIKSGLSATVTNTTKSAHPRIIYPYGDPTGVKLPTLKEIKKYAR